MSLTFKRVLSVLLCAVLLFGAALPNGFGAVLSPLMPGNAAESETVGGNCGAQGDNVKWSLNKTTGTLTFSGTGRMAAYEKKTELPWYQYHLLVRTAVFGSGITNLCQCALNDCISLVHLVISGDVKSIGKYAIRNCDFLRDIYYGGSPEQWAAITVGDGNTSLAIPQKHFYCGGEILEEPYINPNNQYSFNITYHQSEARKMLTRINTLRTQNAWYWNQDNTTKTYLKDLDELEYDYELEQVAMQRAAEIVAMYTDDHARPNGGKLTDLFTDFDPNEAYSYGENIAYHQTSAEKAQTELEEENISNGYYGQAHRRNMLHRQHTAVGLACAEYNGIYFWVQEFRSRQSGAPAVDPRDDIEPTTVTVEILSQNILSSTIYTAAKMVLDAGVITAMPTVNHCFIASDEMIPITHEKEVEWSSSDPTVAYVSGSDLVGVSSGTTTLTGTFDAGHTIHVTVTVTGGSVPSYAVFYNANGAASGTAPATQVSLQGSELTLAANTGGLARPGYTLDGWATEANGEKVYDFGAPYIADAPVTLYAHWTPNPYEIHFNGNGATGGGMQNQPFTYDEAQALTANGFERVFTVAYEYNGATGGNEAQSAEAAASFLGWAAEADGEKIYNNGQSVKNLAESGTCELYAKWTPGTVTLPTPEKTDFYFFGWYADAALTEFAGEAGAAYTPADSVTLYAKWSDTPVTLTGITVKSMPAKTVYQLGEPFAPAGLTLTAAYSDGRTQTVTDGFICSGFDSAAAGSKTVTVSFEGKTASFTVTVLPPDTLQSIAIAVKPGKTSYYIGEAFDKTGLKVTATYSVSGTKEITKYTISSPDMTTAGTKTVTVSYEGKTAAFTITVRGRVRGVSAENVSLNSRASAALKVTIDADDDVKKDCRVKYESSAPKVATVDANGKVTGHKRGTATITCTVTDPAGNPVKDPSGSVVKNTCRVTVNYTPLQWVIIILLFGWIWY